MRDVFFESDHAAKINYPYTDFEWRNINFFSHFHEEIELGRHCFRKRLHYRRRTCTLG